MTPADTLARTPSRSRSTRRDEQPYRLRLDDLGRCLELPGPRALARTFAAPVLTDGRDLLRGTSGTLLSRPTPDDEPTPLDPGALVDDLVAALAALPARPGATQAYADLRLAVAHAVPSELRLYLGKVVRAVRLLCPPAPPPPRPAKHPAKSALERKRQERARTAERGRAASEWWLREHHKTQTPGATIPASTLWDQAHETLSALLENDACDPETWAEDYVSDGAPEVLVLPTRRTFYGEADRLFGPRYLGHRKTHHYRYPEELMPDRDAFSEAILDRVARLAWEEQRELLLDYLRRRDADVPAAATGTDGQVVDLASRRRTP